MREKYIEREENRGTRMIDQLPLIANLIIGRSGDGTPQMLNTIHGCCEMLNGNVSYAIKITATKILYGDCNWKKEVNFSCNLVEVGVTISQFKKFKNILD